MKFLLNIFAGIFFTSAINSSAENTDPHSARLMELSSRINGNWRYTSDTQPVGITDSWQVLTVETSRGKTSMVVWDFAKQPSFSKALDEITNSKLLMECSNVARLMRIALRHSFLGDVAMRALARNLYTKHKGSHFNVMQELSWQLFEKSDTCANDGKFYAVPFVNLSQYNGFKDGPDGNYNVIRLPNGLYIGFAPDFFTIPRTYDDLARYLFDKFTNSDNLKKDKKAEHAQFCTGLSLKKFKAMRELDQENIGYFVFNPPSIK